eukprot:2701759-Rhodomonas_salina.2
MRSSLELLARVNRCWCLMPSTLHAARFDSTAACVSYMSASSCALLIASRASFLAPSSFQAGLASYSTSGRAGASADAEAVLLKSFLGLKYDLCVEIALASLLTVLVIGGCGMNGPVAGKIREFMRESARLVV